MCFYFCFPPRATACGTRVRYWVRAIAGSVGRRRRSSSAGSICISMRRISIPVSPATAATVFSCVASRKTGRSAFECWRELPQQVTGRRHPNVAGLCAVAASGGATSSVELQPAAWGGGELRDPKGRKSNAQSPANSSAQSTAQISGPCSAQRGAKTVSGFRARRTVAAQSSPQFSAPCQPHCGSAVASPHFRRPRQFLPSWPSANRQNMPIHAGGRRIFCAPLFSFFARLRDSSIFGSPPKSLNRFFRRRAASFDPSETVAFLKESDAKNFRRMLTHPQTADASNLRAAALTSNMRKPYRFERRQRLASL